MRNTQRNSTATEATLSPTCVVFCDSFIDDSPRRFRASSVDTFPAPSSRRRSRRSNRNSRKGLNAADADEPPNDEKRSASRLGKMAAKSTKDTGLLRYAGLNRSHQARNTNSNKKMPCSVVSALATVAGSTYRPASRSYRNEGSPSVADIQSGANTDSATGSTVPVSNRESNAVMTNAPPVVPTVHTPDLSIQSSVSLHLRCNVSACHSTVSNASRSRLGARKPKFSSNS
mmetsp:Transcript_5352/g.22673  ORF Transcript_5352/g.22673 Transcript_5352/m.22673 type:complete len:230 (+) Transcript_5352:743-1432(+)